MIDIIFEYRGGSITLPINPENLVVNRASDGVTTEIVSLGEIIVPQERKLATMSISSFFWSAYSNMPSSIHKNWFIEWQKSKAPARFTVPQLSYDFYVLCQGFNYDVKAGEEEDVYYELALTEYRPYGARKIDFSNETSSGNNPPTPPRVENKEKTPITYTVKDGDSLNSISKRLSPDGTGTWKTLYNTGSNKELIANSISKLPVGKELIVPEDWVTK